MKSKILCLAICLFCIVAALVSCGDKCEAHVDADKNTLCDNCKVPVVTITEEVKTETVEMIVSAIPEGATLADVLVYEKDHVLGTLTKKDFKMTDVVDRYFDFILYTYKAQGSNYKTWVMYNPFNDATVTLFTADHDGEEVRVSDLYGLFAAAIKNYKNSEDGFETYYDVYTCAGEKLFSTKEDSKGKAIEMADEPSFDPKTGCTYITAGIDGDNTVYVIDKNGKLIHKADEDMFIDHPDFVEADDNYGFVIKTNSGFDTNSPLLAAAPLDGMNATIYMYDLSKWIECVYAYEVPTDLKYVQAFALEGGKILVQGLKSLPSDAVNYDILEAGAKYDVVYILVDAAAAKAETVEFGYLITSVDRDTDEYPDAVKYVINANTIENQSFGKSVKLYAKEDLSIVAEWNALLPDFVTNAVALADGNYKGDVKYGEGSEVTKIFDAAGNELATIPNNATVAENWINVDGKYYNFKMQLIFDPKADTENPYTNITSYGSYLLMRKDDNVYYWNATMTAPVMIANHESNQTVVNNTATNFIVKTTTNGVDSYALYSAENVKVLETSVAIDNVSLKTNSSDAYYWEVSLKDGTLYVGK